jgi:hypothetical protein
VATANTTGWKALQDFIDTAPPELTIVLAQETWLGPTRIDEAAAWCERRGWKAGLSAAERAEAGDYVESALALTQRTSTVRSIGTSLPVSDEQLEDEVGVAAYLNQRLGFMVLNSLKPTEIEWLPKNRRDIVLLQYRSLRW